MVLTSDDVPDASEAVEQEENDHSGLNELFGGSGNNSSENDNLDEGIDIRDHSVESQQPRKNNKPLKLFILPKTHFQVKIPKNHF